MTTSIIGIDYSADSAKVGVARALWHDNVLRVVEAQVGLRNYEQQIADWLHGSERTLLALDAPLGWPIELSRSLERHSAGQPVNAEPDRLFHRTTDEVVYQQVGKKPLEVGADRIARSAWSALRFLERLRNRISEPILLAWDPDFPAPVAAIEVYPAATLRALGISTHGYRDRRQSTRRREVIEALASECDLAVDAALLEASTDALDAVVCTLAGAHFLAGSCIPPRDMRLAEIEGWIWVRGGRAQTVSTADRPPRRFGVATTASELLDWCWEVVGDRSPDHVCQCHSEKLITKSGNAQLMRAVLLISAAIDEAVASVPGFPHEDFRTAFRCLRFRSHGPNPDRIVAPVWVIDNHHRYDEKMDWRAGAEVAETFLSDVHAWMQASSDRAAHWPQVVESLRWLPERFAQYDDYAADAIRRCLNTEHPSKRGTTPGAGVPDCGE